MITKYAGGRGNTTQTPDASLLLSYNLLHDRRNRYWGCYCNYRCDMPRNHWLLQHVHHSGHKNHYESGRLPVPSLVVWYDTSHNHWAIQVPCGSDSHFGCNPGCDNPHKCSVYYYNYHYDRHCNHLQPPRELLLKDKRCCGQMSMEPRRSPYGK